MPVEFKEVKEELKQLRIKFEENAKTIEVLRAENRKIGQLLENIDSKLTGNKKRVGFLFEIEEDLKGFTLSQRKTGGKHAYWYAGKRVNEKLIWVYVGKDKSKAEEKIRAWLKKNEEKPASKREKKVETKELFGDLEKKKPVKGLKKKVEKKVEVEESLYEEEKIEVFHQQLKEFQNKAKEIAKEFKEKGKDSIVELQRARDSFVKKQKHVEFKVGARLAYVIEHGGLQSISDGKYWTKHRLGFYDVSQETKTILEDEELSFESLKLLFQLLRVGLPKTSKKEELEKALLKQISIRAHTR